MAEMAEDVVVQAADDIIALFPIKPGHEKEALAVLESALAGARIAGASTQREKDALIAEEYECHLEKAESHMAASYYEGGMTDASFGIAAAIREQKP